MERWNQEIPKVEEMVTRYCGRFFRNLGPHLLVLAGSSGCGKTRAMKGAHRWVNLARVTAAEEKYWDWPATVEWINWPQLIRDVVERDMRMYEAIEAPMNAGILFLDDVGAESDKYRSAENIDALCQLLSRREEKWTMLSTNFRPNMWAKQFDARVADRLLRGSVVCDIACGSFSTRP